MASSNHPITKTAKTPINGQLSLALPHVPEKPAVTGFSGEPATPLGIYAKSSSPSIVEADQKRRLLRADRYRFLAVARELLMAEGRKKQLKNPHDEHRTAKCLHIRREGHVTLHQSTEHGSAFYSGLVTCGSVWACPVCAAKVQERRRLELAAAIDWAWDSRYQPMMVTLTAPHYRDQSLVDLRRMQAAALSRLRAGKAGIQMRKALGYRGLIRGLELTYGGNGWHLHTHELWIVDKHADPEVARGLILEQWRAACARAGLLDLDDVEQVRAFDQHSVDVRGNCSASDYLAKHDDAKHWGIDREMAKASTKKGRASGLHPFGLLAAAADGDLRSGRLFVEYVQGMRGARQLYWSKGLKDLVGIDDLTDEKIAERTDDDAVILGRLSVPQWNAVLAAGARARLLDAAELGGWEAVTSLLDSLEKPPKSGPIAASGGACEPPPAPCAVVGESGGDLPAVVAVAPECADAAPVPDLSGLSVVWIAGQSWLADLETGELVAPADCGTPEPAPCAGSSPAPAALSAPAGSGWSGLTV